VWIREDAPVRAAAGKAVRRAADKDRDERPPARNRKAPPTVRKELGDVLPQARATRAEQRLMDAAKAFERERYRDAAKMLRPLADEAPGAASVRELYGLTLYRLGRWADAARELEAFRKLTGSVEQHPVLADCHRALRHWKSVDKLWAELRQASPGASLVTEGRIVAAGARADQGDMGGAIRLLADRAEGRPKRPDWHHLRLWYALGDLYERAGDLPKARELFMRVAKTEPDFADVAERLQTI
jgi:tetratricopeptide (TPR) repeat protein